MNPLITVTHGRPTPAEIAAVVAVLLATSASRASNAAPGTPLSSHWADRSRAVLAPPRPGRGAWRASALPR